MKLTFCYAFTKEKEILKWFLDGELEKPNNFVMPKNFQNIKPATKTYILKIQNEIQDKWFSVEKDFFDIVKKFDLKTQNHYICYVTRFGCSGLYFPPKSFMIRISQKIDLKESVINIAHELAHLILKANGREKKLNYIQREKQVDEFLSQTNFVKIIGKYPKQNFDEK